MTSLVSSSTKKSLKVSFWTNLNQTDTLQCAITGSDPDADRLEEALNRAMDQSVRSKRLSNIDYRQNFLINVDPSPCHKRRGTSG